MIVHDLGGRLRLVTQPDHAHFAARLVALWRADGLPEHPRRTALIEAVREHDNGWRELDSAPRVDLASGRPHDFLSLPRAERTELWRRGARRFAEERPYVALLTAHHALCLHREHRTGGELDDFLGELDELEEELLEKTGLGPEELEADYRTLDVADHLSLVVANGWREPFERRGWRGRLADGALLLDPFPLAGATTFRVPCRTIPDRPYAGDADLAVELATARWEEMTVRVAPLES